MPDGSKMDPPLAKAEPISDGGDTGIPCHAQSIAGELAQGGDGKLLLGNRLGFLGLDWGFLDLVVNGNFLRLPQFLKYDGYWLGNFICQFLQDLQMHLIRSHRLVHLQVLQLVSNLVFTYSRQFLFLRVFAFCYLGGVARALTHEDQGKKSQNLQTCVYALLKNFT
ncbi:hypothetical protein llap_15995 [Limosa lapponica baueri]|uniref:Uncharacterized protein n=1 Tax=Limosa lapponica baueri TaxID=1758121 RepID=A0A2I0TIS5_LIMLA|nr:hypothetical protein llap_15995 [Limosa lapponica baueri]